MFGSFCGLSSVALFCSSLLPTLQRIKAVACGCRSVLEAKNLALCETERICSLLLSLSLSLSLSFCAPSPDVPLFLCSGLHDLNASPLQRMGGQRFYENEDLALFEEVRARERRKFLISSPNFGASSLQHEDELLNLNTVAVTPSRKSSELLVSDAEKNDYDWLLTPPSTPLFPHLEQEALTVNEVSQKRLLTRSVSASRISRDFSLRAYGRNPSPLRPSNASSSSGIVLLRASRERPASSSARVRSPVQSSPGRLAQGRGASRSLTPTRKSSSSGSNRAERSRGKSLSPKPPSLEPYVPDFSDALPPNIRTDLLDWCPGVSRHTRSKSKVESRQSCTPNTSGRWIQSPILVRDSPAAKGFNFNIDVQRAESIASNGMMTSCRRKSSKAARCNVQSGRSDLLSKRQTRISHGRHFDRQEAHCCSERMFRPLMSNAPAISFYGAFESSNTLTVTSLSSSENVEHVTKHVIQKKNSEGEDDTQGESGLSNSLFLDISGHLVGDGCVQINDLHSGKTVDMVSQNEICSTPLRGSECNNRVQLEDSVENVSYEKSGFSAAASNGAATQGGLHKHLYDTASFWKQSNSKISSKRFHDGISNFEGLVGEISAGSQSACGGCASANLNERPVVSHDLEPSISRETALKLVGLTCESLGSYQEKESQGSSQSRHILKVITKSDVVPVAALGTDREVICDREVPDVGGMLIRSQAQEKESTEQVGALSILGFCMGETMSHNGPQQHCGSADVFSKMDTPLHCCTYTSYRPTATDTIDSDEQVGKEAISNGTPKLLLKHSLTLEEATDTILFCSSILHEIVYKAVSVSIEAGKENTMPPSKKEFVALFSLSEGNYKKHSKKRETRQRRTISRQTLSQVQIKQRMMHQQTMAVTLHHRPIDKIENAVMGNNEEMLLPTRSMATRRSLTKQGRKISCKCRCSIM